MCDCANIIVGRPCPGCGRRMCGECEINYAQCLDCAADEAIAWNAQQQVLVAPDDPQDIALPVNQGCPNACDLLDDNEFRVDITPAGPLKESVWTRAIRSIAGTRGG